MGALAVAVLFAASFLIVNRVDKPICEKCNVILVSLDTVSALHLPCYGYERNTAPNLCAFADKNIFFLNSYAQSPRRLDSHFSIFTSLYPHTHKMTEILGNDLSQADIALAQVFSSNGYETVYNGPLNDIHLPFNRGIGRGFGVVQGKDKETIDTWGEAYSKLLENNNKKKPTFIFLHTYMAHEPYFTGHKAKHPFTNSPELPNIPLTQEDFLKRTPEFYSFAADRILRINPESATGYFKLLSSERDIAEKLRRASSLKDKEFFFNAFSERVKGTLIFAWNDSKIDYSDPKQTEYLKALYDEQINNLDGKLKELFDLISNPKIAKNTILIITADQGKEFMEHGRLEDGTGLYRTLTQVPLIMHIPGVKPKKISDIVQGIDIYPTLLSLTGLTLKSGLEGIDLTGMIEGKSDAAKNKYVLSEYRGIVSLQSDNWRYYYDYKNNKPLELYNLTADPGEKNNIISDYPEKIRQYTRELSNINLERP